MSYRSKTQIAIIILIIFAMEFFHVVYEEQQKIIQNYEIQIAQLTQNYETRIVEYAKQEALYKENLTNIVDKLYKTEIYGVGGKESVLDIEMVYEAVMTTATNFNVLLARVDNYFEEREEYLSAIPCVWPVERNSTVRVTSGFGPRISPLTGEVFFHEGIDIVAHDLQTPILATADGIVTESWPAPDSYWEGHPIFGGTIRIQHANGFTTLYAHLSHTVVQGKNEVKQGQIIGYMGETGKVVGRHLHYEIRKDGELQNPIDYLRWN